MFISVIIPTCDRVDELSACLLSLTGQSIPEGLSFEVIITDDSPESSARLPVYRHFPSVKWVKGPGCGPAANRNNGCIHANGDWFAFIDDDCIPDDDYFANVEREIRENPFSSIIEGYTYPGREKRRYDEESAVNTTGGLLWSCNVLLKRRTFLQLQGFCDEFSLPFMEDLDLHLRIKARGIPVFFGNSIRIRHPWRKRKSLRFKLAALESIKLLCCRHPVVRSDFNRSKYFRHLFAGMAGRTHELIRFRFRGFAAYMEDPFILLYYLIRS